MLYPFSRVPGKALHVATGGLLFLAFHGTSAQVSDICIPTIGGLVAEPTMDGRPQDDLGWNNAGQLGIRENVKTTTGISAGTTRSGNFQYGVLNGFLYLSIDLDAFTLGTNCPNSSDPNAKCLGVNDKVVIALSTDASPANDWRFQISPFDATQTGTGNPVFDKSKPREVEYWRNSGTWNVPKGTNICNASRPEYSDCQVLLPLSSAAADVGTVLSGTTACNPMETGRFVVSRNGSRWGLEAKLPYTTDPRASNASCKLILPAASTFSFYVNLVSTNDFVAVPSMGPQYVEDPWPFAATLNTSGIGLIETSTPDRSAWGTASLTTRSACTGVAISQAGVRQTPTGALGWTSSAVPGAGTDPNDGKYFYLRDPSNAGSTRLKDADACADNTNLTNDTVWPSTVSAVNHFVAQASSTSPTASDVFARFYIAPWGLPGPQDWDKIGERFRPTARSTLFDSGSQSIGTTAAEFSTDWALSYRESCAYALSNVVGYYAGKPIGHHCVQAELFATTDPNTNFTRKSLQFNHNVLPASRVQQQATIGTRGYGVPANNRYHEVMLGVDRLARKYKRDGGFYDPVRGGDATSKGVSPTFAGFAPIAAGSVSGAVSEALDLVARGYLATGDTLVIGGTTYHRARFIGAFTLEAAHDGPVDQWTVSLAPIDCPPNSPPQDCMSGSGSGYVVRIPQDESLRIVATVEAQAPGTGPSGLTAIWLGLGGTYPHGSFRNGYDGSGAVELGLEHAFNSGYAVEATLGTNRFKGKAGARDLDVTRLGVNAKWYFPQPSFKPFVTLGIGAYAFNPGSTRMGANAGVGAQFDIAPHWSIEGRYGLHAVSGNSPNSTYSTLSVDLRYAF